MLSAPTAPVLTKLPIVRVRPTRSTSFEHMVEDEPTATAREPNSAEAWLKVSALSFSWVLARRLSAAPRRTCPMRT